MKWSLQLYFFSLRLDKERLDRFQAAFWFFFLQAFWFFWFRQIWQWIIYIYLGEKAHTCKHYKTKRSSMFGFTFCIRIPAEKCSRQTGLLTINAFIHCFFFGGSRLLSRYNWKLALLSFLHLHLQLSVESSRKSTDIIPK